MNYNWKVACILQPDFSLIYGAKVNDRQGQQKFLRDSELLSIPFCREGEKTCMLMIGLCETHEHKWNICGSVPGSQTAIRRGLQSRTDPEYNIVQGWHEIDNIRSQLGVC